MPQLATAIGGTQFIRKPLTRQEVIDMQGADDKINVNVSVYFPDIVENDLEAYFDLVSELAIGDICLQEIETRIVDAANDNSAVVNVTGYVEDDDLDRLSD